jgi:hypothetical protein
MSAFLHRNPIYRSCFFYPLIDLIFYPRPLRKRNKPKSKKAATSIAKSAI